MKAILYLLIFLFCCLPASAVYVDSGTVFIATNTTFQIATPFNCTNVSIYSDAFNVDGGNFTATNTTEPLNISLENLDNTTPHLNFTSNVTTDLLTISNGFANFSVINGNSYGIYTQTGNVLQESYNATNSLISYINIPIGSYFITLYTSEIIDDKWYNNLIDVIQGFISVMDSILTLFVSTLPLLIGCLICGFLIMLCVGIFGKLKRW